MIIHITSILTADNRKSVIIVTWLILSNDKSVIIQISNDYGDFGIMHLINFWYATTTPPPPPWIKSCKYFHGNTVVPIYGMLLD